MPARRLEVFHRFPIPWLWDSWMSKVQEYPKPGRAGAEQPFPLPRQGFPGEYPVLHLMIWQGRAYRGIDLKIG